MTIRIETRSPWRCVKTWLPDASVERRLQRVGLSTFRPEIHRYSQRNGREMRRNVSLFPGYVFIRASEPAEHSLACQATGVAYMLGNRIGDDFRPAEIPSEWIDDLVQLGPTVEGRAAPFRKGDKVRLAIGRLASLISEIEGFDKSGKAIIYLTLFGVRRAVHVPVSELERAG